MGETKIIYHLDGQETPYLVKINAPADRVTLGDFKNVLKKPNYKFFFKSIDVDFGVVKEEITDDNAKLPCYNGRVISWLVSEDSGGPDSQTEAPSPLSLAPPTQTAPPVERTGGLGDSRPPSFHATAAGHQEVLQSESDERGRQLERRKEREREGRRREGQLPGAQDPGGEGPEDGDSSSSLLSSQLETSFCDSEEEDSGDRFSESTEQSASRPVRRQRRRRRPAEETAHMESESLSSVTGSSMSLNILSVTLNTDKYAFLGISIVGQSNERGDGGIYIGSIMKGGAVAADGRIEPGDMLLQVNDITFENMSNDEAVRVLRDIVHKPGSITLTVAKCWDPQPQGCFALPRSEPVRPIDPAAWVSHTAAMTGLLPPHYEVHEDLRLTIHCDMASVAKAMAHPESGVEVRDRTWLKMTIPNAFIGSEVVDWLHQHLEGFSERREARRYASALLTAGYIRHTLTVKISFSEQCYYVFRDMCGDLAQLSLTDDRPPSDACAPVHHLGAPEGPWPPLALPVPHPYSAPPPLLHLPHWEPAGSPHSDSEGGLSNQGSGHSRSQYSGRPGQEVEAALQPHPTTPEAGAPPAAAAAGPPLVEPPPPSPPGRGHDLSPGGAELPPPSHQSFRLAVGNASNFLLDVM